MNSKNSKPGQSRKKPPALGIQELALVGWLAADPQNRFAMASDRSFSCYEKLDPREDGKRPVRKLADWEKDEHSAVLKSWFGGTINCKHQRVADAGHVVSYAMLGTLGRNDRALFREAVEDIYIPGQWNLNSRYIAITPSGSEWWESEGREAHSVALEKLARATARDRAAERRAVFGWVSNFEKRIPDELQDRLPAGYEMPLPKLKGRRPMLTAIIVRETAERYYVRDVRSVRQGESITAHVAVREHGKEHYIEKYRLMLDHASDAAISALANFDAEQQQDHNERCRRAAEELLPILRRHAEVSKQNEAGHDDRLCELLVKLAGTPE